MRVGPAERIRIARQIKIKSALVEAWIKSNIPWRTDASGNLIRNEKLQVDLDFYPRGPVDFAKWDVSLHAIGNRERTFEVKDDDGSLYTVSLSELTSFSRTSLTQPYHAEKARKAIARLSLLQNRAKVQLEQSCTDLIIESLKLEVKHLNQVITEQQRECREARTEARKAKTELALERDEAARNYAEHKRVNTLLEEKISTLVRDFSKIKPLSSTKGKR